MQHAPSSHMHTIRALILLLLPTLLTACVSQPADQIDLAHLASVYPDPARFEADIAAFEAQDAAGLPPNGAVLCLGSSSIRLWHPTLERDLEPLTLIRRGFGGSTMYDALHFADRIALPYVPRAILLYEGDNDIAAGVSAEDVAAAFDALVAKVHAAHPRTRFYFIAIKPSIARRQLWPEMDKANTLIANRCKRDQRLHYIDIASPMLNADGEPRKALFQPDMLHLNPAGYAEWTRVVREVMVEAERGYENYQ